MSQNNEMQMRMCYGVNQADACQAFALGEFSQRIQQNLRDIDSRIIRLFLYDKGAPDPVTQFNTNCTMLKVLDYMAAGRPQVAFPLPETEALAGDAALIVEANSARALAEGILKLLGQPDLRARMGEAAIRLAKNGLLWCQSAARLLAAYDRALLRHPHVRPSVS